MQTAAAAPPYAKGGWVSTYREKNLSIFEEKPVKKSKYTSISKLESFLQANLESMQVMPKIKSGTAKVLSLPDALAQMPQVLGTIAAKEEKARDQFEAFLNSNFNSGFVLVVTEKNTEIIEFDLNIPQGACTKYFIVVEEGAQANIVQRITSSGRALYSETVYVGQNADATVVRIHEESSNVISSQQAILEKDARLKNNNTWMGGETVRASVVNILEDDGASVKECSMLLAKGAQHFDINYSSIHRSQSSESLCVFKSALKDESHNVFDGMIRIETTGEKTNALLECHSMILGNKASSNQIPGLEIKTDDVKATHSATVSRMEDDEIFYLESRGLSKAEAEKMVVKSFLESIVYMLPENIRKPIQDKLDLEM